MRKNDKNCEILQNSRGKNFEKIGKNSRGKSQKFKFAKLNFAKISMCSLVIFAISFFSWLNFAPKNQNLANAENENSQNSTQNSAKKSAENSQNSAISAQISANSLGASDQILAMFWSQAGTNYDQMTLNAYLKSGEKLAVSASAYAGLNFNGVKTTILNPSGAEIFACDLPVGTPKDETCASEILADEDGVYQIKFTADAAVSVNQYHFLWSAKISDENGDKISGRIFTDTLILDQNYDLEPTPEIIPNLTLYAVNDAGYIYKIDLTNYMGYGSRISADAAGLVNPENSCNSAYESSGALSGDSANWKLAGENCVKYRIFLDEPAPDLPQTAQSANGEMKILPALLDLNSTLVNDFSWISSDEISQTGVFKIDLNTDFAGNFVVQIDVNDNGIFGDAADRDFAVSALGGTANQNLLINFDGKDGNGNLISAEKAMSARVKFDKFAEIHFVFDDVEGLGGVEISRLNGENAGVQKIYWNDTKLNVDNPANLTFELCADFSCGGDGVNSAGGAHGWWGSAHDFGNYRKIDNWTYISAQNVDKLRAEIPAKFAVIFEENGGTKVEDQGVLPQGYAKKPQEISRENHTFCGWFSDENLTETYNFSAPVLKNLMLYACWKKDEIPAENIESSDENSAEILAPNTGFRAKNIFAKR